MGENGGKGVPSVKQAGGRGSEAGDQACIVRRLDRRCAQADCSCRT
jgi:hypothetical protein